MMAGLITNGYLLSPKRIQALNDAGLDYMQISIDNVEPDEVSKKSLRLLDRKLQWLPSTPSSTSTSTRSSAAGRGTPRTRARSTPRPGARASRRRSASFTMAAVS